MFFSSVPVVSSSIFVGAEREENLIRNFPTRASLRLNGSKSSEFSLVTAYCRLGQSGSPRSGKRTDSLVKVDKFTRSSRCGFVAQWLERATGIRKILRSIPCGAALCFFRLIRLSVLLSLSELKEKRI